MLASEQERLRASGRDDLAERVRHIALLEGDGAGYDIASFELDGSPRFIEVKATKGAANTDFFVSANEVEFTSKHRSAYYLYRRNDFDQVSLNGKFYLRRGSLREDSPFHLQPTQFRARLSET